jgi:hypothetical protein
MNADESDVSDVSDVVTVTQPSPGSYSGRGRSDLHVQVHANPDSLLSETERRIINALGGSRGEALRRSLVHNRETLQRTRINANGTAAAVRFDVEEYIGVLEARYIRDFREVGAQLGRVINQGKKRQSEIRFRR